MEFKELYFSAEQQLYRGKVRDVYTIGETLVMIASDRISAFDHILSKPIPYKGQVLNLMAAYFLENSRDIVPNWLHSVPHPNVSIGIKCVPIPIEIVVRGYLAGHAARIYKSGGRVVCGVSLPEGLREGDRLPSPIITPTTKAAEGHDEDISVEAILEKGVVTKAQWDELSKYALALFERGSKMAKERSLILVDTKYEFGFNQGAITLMDEIHTPDSSRYYLMDGYEERQSKGEAQIQLSKEFVREWLIANGFQGKEGQVMPFMPEDFVAEVSQRYRELYEKITGQNFKPYDEPIDVKAIQAVL